ncbi:hypothetical protein BD847_2704 [Flavobacterium cutihirudinis]|uniref:Uncharacterized protein n=1 Tax=Flavobacterium cutihirudinis TaxID=1265740 RepID=A0A3D9FSU6_9FLAO|nr:hypothetical protein BD847_2704 [Flavobacterium cutihirudinis]
MIAMFVNVKSILFLLPTNSPIVTNTSYSIFLSIFTAQYYYTFVYYM